MKLRKSLIYKMLLYSNIKKVLHLYKKIPEIVQFFYNLNSVVHNNCRVQYYNLKYNVKHNPL